MATTGELRAIIKLLELEDVGDASSYLGEESIVVYDFLDEQKQDNLVAHVFNCMCVSCQILRS